MGRLPLCQVKIQCLDAQKQPSVYSAGDSAPGAATSTS